MKRIAGLLVAGLMTLNGAAHAQDYPNRPVTIIVGFGQGGPDTNARLLAAQINAQSGANVVVENKPGAGSMIGTEAVVQAQPDGYTLLMTSAALATLPALQKQISFDPLKDLVPVSLVARSEASFLVASPSLPVNDLVGLLQYAKLHPVTYGSSGVGASSHLRMAVFAAKNGLKLIHLPFKSTGDSVASVMNGETQLLFVTASQAIPIIKEGRVKALGYDADKRARFLPNVPTIAEAGATPTGMDSGWNGILAPKGTPPEVIAWLEKQIKTAAETPGIRSKIEGLGLEVVASNSAEFGKVLAAAIDSMDEAVRIAGISPK